jgi:hypothetical protein
MNLLMNFGCETFRDGVKRVANGHNNFAPSRLCVKQSDARASTTLMDENSASLPSILNP